MGPIGAMGGMQDLEGGMQGPEGGMQGPEGGMQGPEGGMQGPEGGMQGPEGGMQGMPGIQQELSEALNQFKQDMEQLGGGTQPPGSTNSSSGGPAGGAGNSQLLNDLGNLETDSGGKNSLSGKTGGDLKDLETDVKNAMADGSMSEQEGTQALQDISQDNIPKVLQDLGAAS